MNQHQPPSIYYLLVISSLLLQVSQHVEGLDNTTTSSSSSNTNNISSCSIRNYINEIEKELNSLKCLQSKLSSAINLLQLYNTTSMIIEKRSKSLLKVSNAINQLNIEYSVLNDKCSHFKGDNCYEGCIDGYTGNDCKQLTCFGILSSDNSTVCSGYGQCIGPNICNCTISNTIGLNCKPNITLLIRDQVKGYYFENNYYAKSCKEYKNPSHAYKYSNEGSGLYQIKPGQSIMTVYCDMETDGGGWTLFAAIKYDYTGPHFHVFDDKSSTETISFTSFHLNTTELLSISNEIRTGTDKSSNPVQTFYTSNWPQSASCIIPDTLRNDISITKSKSSYTELSSFNVIQRSATCKSISGGYSAPTHMSYCKTGYHSIGFKMGFPYGSPSTNAEYTTNSYWTTFSYANAPEGSYYIYNGIQYNADGSTSRNGALFLR